MSGDRLTEADLDRHQSGRLPIHAPELRRVGAPLFRTPKSPSGKGEITIGLAHIPRQRCTSSADADWLQARLLDADLRDAHTRASTGSRGNVWMQRLVLAGFIALLIVLVVRLIEARQL